MSTGPRIFATAKPVPDELPHGYARCGRCGRPRWLNSTAVREGHAPADCVVCSSVERIQVYRDAEAITAGMTMEEADAYLDALDARPTRVRRAA